MMNKGKYVNVRLTQRHSTDSKRGHTIDFNGFDTRSARCGERADLALGGGIVGQDLDR